uniref:Con-ikot-ikot 2 n=1 Tax=Conus geographus TaxID=6491 RepID=W4VRZ3_CONGE
MAMNMSVMLSAFVMVVVSATVTGFTHLQEPDLSRMERSPPPIMTVAKMKECCAQTTELCLKEFPNEEHIYTSTCYQRASHACGQFNEIVGCCYGYRQCMLQNVQNLGLNWANQQCKEWNCLNPCE